MIIIIFFSKKLFDHTAWVKVATQLMNEDEETQMRVYGDIMDIKSRVNFSLLLGKKKKKNSLGKYCI